ncbi:MAG: hypothetical protein ACRD15_11185, partial [Vicinamibacterales bacterium]
LEVLEDLGATPVLPHGRSRHLLTVLHRQGIGQIRIWVGRRLVVRGRTRADAPGGIAEIFSSSMIRWRSC